MSDDNNWAGMANEGFNQEFEFDTDGVDSSKIGNETSMLIDKPGKYHVEITSAKNYLDTVDDKGKATAPHCVIVMTVLHSTPNQSPEGYRLIARAFIAGSGGGPREQWQTETTLNLLTGAGLCIDNAGKLIDPETGTNKLNWKTWPERLVGKQFIADVHVNKCKELLPDGSPKYPDRYELPFGRGLYLVDDPKVAGVPKNAVALQLIKGNGPTGNSQTGNGQANGSLAANSQSASTQPANPETAKAPAAQSPAPATQPSAAQPPVSNPPPSAAGSAGDFDDI